MGGYGEHGGHSAVPLPETKVEIGNREVVGFGGNGEATYIDSVMAPFPAIRFKEDVGEIAALRVKEQGDWKKMTKEEKKALYRASFCQTLAEVEAPTGRLEKDDKRGEEGFVQGELLSDFGRGRGSNWRVEVYHRTNLGWNQHWNLGILVDEGLCLW